jgi:hypothetical protein
MMSTINLLTTSDLTKHLKIAFNNASTVTLISAYLTKPAVDFLFDILPLGVKTVCVVRARPQDLLSGSCDLQAIKILHYSGVRCYINRELHAKLYVVDNYNGFIGSANFTTQGLKLFGIGNFELSTKITLGPSDLALIQNLIDDSVLVTNNILKKLEKFIKEHISERQNTLVDEWWDNILELKPYSTDQGLYVGDLPWCHFDKENSSDALEHDKDLFGFSDDDTGVIKFKHSKIYQFLKIRLQETEDKQIYFGTLTELIHSALKDDTLPYRSEVKDYVANVYSYLEKLASDEMKVDRPNHSQRITLISEYE